MVYKFFDKKIGSGVRATSKTRTNVNEILVQELNKPVNKKLKRREVYPRFNDDIWVTNLAEMGSLSSKNGGVKYLSCAIYIFTKYARVNPLTDNSSW